METTLPAAHRAKRRKPEAPESAEQEEDGVNISPHPATKAPDSSPPGAGGDEPYLQNPAPGAGGGEEGEGIDRISLLPDAILGEVISLLPTKDAARTQILATRWRHLWRSAPLNLDGSFLSMDAVSRILSAHRGPGRRFRFPALRLHDHPAIMDAWLRSPALDNLQEIDCWFHFIWGRQEEVLPPPPLPASAFRFSSCLCVATLSQYHLSDDVAQGLQFPKLKKLALKHVSISEYSLHSIIAGSPVLECLLLSTIFSCHHVRINSASLTSLGVGANVLYEPEMTILEEFVIEDAPCLKRILYLRETCMRLQVSVISAPNLETLGCLSYSDYSSRLTLGSMIIEPGYKKDFQVFNSTPSACTVKILAVKISSLSLDVIIDLMRCFPCLEKLYIESCQGGETGDKNLWRRKHRNLIKCLDIRLKTLVLNFSPYQDKRSYRGTRSQVNFATFFVLNAKMLESMTFQDQRFNVSERFLAEQHKLLQLEKRASRRAQFYFTTKGCHHEFMHINHVHDLSIIDPFKCEGTRVCHMRIL